MHNKSMSVSTNATTETTLKHRFNGTRFGSTYLVTVATDVDNALPSLPVEYVAPRIARPHQVKVLYTNTSFTVYWEEDAETINSIPSDVKYHYEVFISEGERQVNETTAKVIEVNQPPFTYPNAKTGIIYSFAVRLATQDGYQSLFSETVSTEISGCK